MDHDLKRRAGERLEKAIEEEGVRDPRGYYRDRLRELRSADPDAYDEAVHHYEEVLIPAVAGDEVDPLEAWEEFGRRIAKLTADGRTVEIDASGRSHPHEPPAARTRLVLHLPEVRKRGALLVSLPPEPSPAQRAAYDLLVEGRRTLRG